MPVPGTFSSGNTMQSQKEIPLHVERGKRPTGQRRRSGCLLGAWELQCSAIGKAADTSGSKGSRWFSGPVNKTKTLSSTFRPFLSLRHVLLESHQS